MTKQALRTYSEWMDCAKAIEWEAFVTVRIPPDLHPSNAEPEIRSKVIRPLAKHLKISLSAIIVISLGHGKHRPHAHLLLVSKDCQLSTHLDEAADFLKSNRTTINTHANAINLLPFDAHERDHSRYVEKHVIDDGDIFFYGAQLLRELKAYDFSTLFGVSL